MKGMVFTLNSYEIQTDPLISHKFINCYNVDEFDIRVISEPYSYASYVCVICEDMSNNNAIVTDLRIDYLKKISNNIVVSGTSPVTDVDEENEEDAKSKNKEGRRRRPWRGVRG